MIVSCSTLETGLYLFYSIQNNPKNDRSPYSFSKKMLIYLYGEVQP